MIKLDNGPLKAIKKTRNTISTIRRKSILEPTDILKHYKIRYIFQVIEFMNKTALRRKVFSRALNKKEKYYKRFELLCLPYFIIAICLVLWSCDTTFVE